MTRFPFLNRSDFTCRTTGDYCTLPIRFCELKVWWPHNLSSTEEQLSKREKMHNATCTGKTAWTGAPRGKPGRGRASFKHGIKDSLLNQDELRLRITDLSGARLRNHYVWQWHGMAASCWISGSVIHRHRCSREKDRQIYGTLLQDCCKVRQFALTRGIKYFSEN